MSPIPKYGNISGFIISKTKTTTTTSIVGKISFFIFWFFSELTKVYYHFKRKELAIKINQKSRAVIPNRKQ